MHQAWQSPVGFSRLFHSPVTFAELSSSWVVFETECFPSCVEIGENTAPVSIRKRRYLGVGCVCTFYWSFNSNLVNVKLQLEYWTASLNIAGKKVSPYSLHSRKLSHLVKKKKRNISAETQRHKMFSEETACFQSSKENSKEASTSVKKKNVKPKFSFKKSFQDVH